MGSTIDIDNSQYQILSIGTHTVDLIDLDNGNRHTVALENIEWQDDWKEFRVCLTEDGDVDEYTSGYADAIRDIVKYLNNEESMITTTLEKIGIRYLSDLDTDEEITEFVSKRFEKKPQLTLDEIKKKLGYDFDLV